MAAQKKTKASKFLTVPTRPVPIDRDRSVAGLLEKMEGAGFGAKQLQSRSGQFVGDDYFDRGYLVIFGLRLRT